MLIQVRGILRWIHECLHILVEIFVGQIFQAFLEPCSLSLVGQDILVREYVALRYELCTQESLSPQNVLGFFFSAIVGGCGKVSGCNLQLSASVASHARGEWRSGVDSIVNFG